MVSSEGHDPSIPSRATGFKPVLYSYFQHEDDIMKMLFSEADYEAAKFKDELSFECERCSSIYTHPKRTIYQHRKGQRKINSYCSKLCKSLHGGFRVETVCSFCQTSFLKVRTEREKTNNDFCSSSCAAKMNNVLFPKKELSLWKTMSDYRVGYVNGPATLRAQARNIYKKSGLPLSCKVCGYNIHVEIAHLRAVADFPDEALSSEVNGLDNLVALCRNHHWEFDNGYLKL